MHPLDSHCQTDSADRQDAAGGEVPGEEQQGETESRRGRKGQNTAAEQTTMTSVTLPLPKSKPAGFAISLVSAQKQRKKNTRSKLKNIGYRF